MVREHSAVARGKWSGDVQTLPGYLGMSLKRPLMSFSAHTNSQLPFAFLAFFPPAKTAAAVARAHQTHTLREKCKNTRCRQAFIRFTFSNQQINRMN